MRRRQDMDAILGRRREHLAAVDLDDDARARLERARAALGLDPTPAPRGER